jgi:YVTN family beta-propeller protein
MSSASELPRGTVTFLFTDIEGSTRLLKQLRERYGDVLSEHQRILRDAFASHSGHEIDTQGDSFFVAFARAKDAVGAALDTQRALAAHGWPDGSQIRVRMGIHTGEPVVGGDRYVGLGVHRAARISAAGHGGQVLVSQTSRELLRDDPLPDVTLRDLGEHQLKDLDEPERIYQLVAPGLREAFPPLKTAAPAPFEGREVELAAAAQDAVEKLRQPWWANRRLQIAAAVVAVLVVVPVVTVLAGGGGGGSAQASGEVEANSVGVVDPKSGKVASQIPVGEAPGGLAYGDNSIWVANTDANSVSRIDPDTNSVRQTIDVGGGPSGVAVSSNAVWVANGLDGTVSRIDPSSNREVQRVTVGNGPTGVAFGAGAVWVASSVDGTVSKIDPGSGHELKRIPVALGAAGVAVGYGRVWVVSPASGRMIVLDARRGEVVDRIGVGGEATAVAVGAGAVWVANRAGTIQRIDPRARVVVSSIDIGHALTALTTTASDLWAANSGDATVSKVDTDREVAVRTVHVVNRPQSLVLTPKGLYVAVRSTGFEHRGGTLRIAAPEPPDSIDPAIAYSQEGWSVLTLTNDGLVAFRRVGGIGGIEIVPDLALSVPNPSSDGLTYTFRLRSGLRYSNGRPVEPEDFRRAIERVLSIGEPQGAQFYRGIVGAGRCKPGKRCDLSRGIVTNKVAQTVTFRLTAPDGDFLSKLALPFAVAVPEGTPAKDIGAKPLPATGPYRIASYRTRRLVTLVRNPTFRSWSADARPEGYPDVISWRVGHDLNGRAVRAVERGTADVAQRLAPGMSKDDLEALATQHASQLHFSSSFSTHFFFLNTSVRPFDDIRVRRAVNLAFDRQAFAQLLGRGFAPTCQILPPNYPAYHPACPYVPTGVVGLEKARRLVHQSGTSGSAITVWVPAPLAIQGKYVVSVLDSLGYRARLHKASPANGFDLYFRDVLDSRRRIQIGFYGWFSDFPSVQNFLKPIFSCAAFVPGSPERTSNASELCNHSIDAEIARSAAVQALDPAKGNVLWQRTERSILELAPMIPTATRLNVDLVSERVGNYQYHPQWGVLLDQLWVK